MSDTKMIPGGINFMGLPVVVSPAVPRDEVWLRTKNDLVRIVNLDTEEKRLRRRIATLEARLRRLAKWGYERRPPHRNPGVWSRKHGGGGR